MPGCVGTETRPVAEFFILQRAFVLRYLQFSGKSDNAILS